MRQDITKRIKTFSDACEELNRRAEAGDEEAVALLRCCMTMKFMEPAPAYRILRLICNCASSPSHSMKIGDHNS